MNDGSWVSSFICVVVIDDELSIMNRMSRFPGLAPRLTARDRDSTCATLSGAQPPASATTTESRRAEEKTDDKSEDETKDKRATKRVMNASTS
jgi:hypothetical protein